MSLLCTTPKKISLEILELCKKAVPSGRPLFVNVSIDPESAINECFTNVERYTAKHGGKSVLGWQIWEWPGVFAEAELHSVWKSPDGTLIDVSPKVDGEKLTLFVPDESLKIPSTKVDNIRTAIAKGEVVRDYIKALEIFFRFTNREQPNGGAPFTQYHGSKLHDAIRILKRMLKKGRAPKGKCVCGSHLSYKDCHREDVKSTIEEMGRLSEKF